MADNAVWDLRQNDMTNGLETPERDESQSDDSKS